MVEKLGHKKRIQMMRMDWINEGKPKPVDEENLYGEPTIEPREDRERTATRIAPIFEKQTTERLKTPAGRENIDDDDIYGATPKTTQPAKNPSTSIFGGDSGANSSIFGPKEITETVEDGPPEDDLDALFAEEDFMTGPSNSAAAPARPVQQDNFDDEEEAMAEMEGMW